MDYPCSDGEPMSDNTLQYQWIVTIQGGLDLELPDFVAGNILWYPVQGHPLIRIGPDVLVALGRPKGHRSSYLQWEEDDVAPQVVWEVLSPSNTRQEMHQKLMFYDRHGVQEYYVVDPYDNAIEGYRREGAHLSPVEIARGWVSPLLGIRVEQERGIRLYHRDGRRFSSFVELGNDLATQRRRADMEAQRATEAEARAEALAARLRALGIEP